MLKKKELFHFNPNHDERGRFASYNSDDDFYPKGARFSRVTLNPDEKFKDRMYVSQDPEAYLEVVERPGKEVYQIEYEVTKDVVVAGKQAIEQVVSELGMTPKDMFTEEGNYYHPKENEFVFGGHNADFYKNNTRFSKKVTKKLKAMGYDALIDPVDVPMSYCDTAVIFINNVFKKTGQEVVS